MTDLIDAVDALTRPTRTKVIRDDNTTVTVDHDPLLVQLEQAITSAIGNGGGGGSATGSVINDAALYQLVVIKSQIGDWCRLARVRPTRDLITNLNRWRVAFISLNTDHGFYTRTLQGWAQTIIELLDPPKTIPLAGPCPVCKATVWEDGEGDSRTIRSSPVAVQYDQTLLHASLRAVCRAESCEALWSGADALEELIEEMSEAEPQPTVSGREDER